MSQPSLMRHLLAWTLGALVVVWAGFIGMGFRTGVHEADELTDGHLASVAALLLNLPGSERARPDDRSTAALVARPELKSHDYQQSMSIVIWNHEGDVLRHEGEGPVPPFSQEEGFADLSFGVPKVTWRTFARSDRGERPRRVMVMIKEEERDGLAWDIAMQIAEPGFWLLPAIALVLGLAVRRGLRPLYELSQDVHALDVQHDTALVARHPQAEFKEVVEAINLLMRRHEAALARERQLADELAHELRTPLASLTLHARSLRGSLDETERAESLHRIEADALRAGEVLSEVLALARASRSELAEAAQSVDVAELARDVVAGFAQDAHESGHDLSFAGPERLAMKGHPVLIELALRNLVENALNHTPAGTRVEVRLDADGRWLQVSDNGRVQAPAVAPDKRAGRTLGLGLGHRVAEKVAAIHGGTFARLDTPGGTGAAFRLSFGDAIRLQPEASAG